MRRPSAPPVPPQFAGAHARRLLAALVLVAAVAPTACAAKPEPVAPQAPPPEAPSAPRPSGCPAPSSDAPREGQGTRARSIVAAIERRATAVRHALAKARADRDVIDTLCKTEKLTRLDVTLRSAKEHRTALEAAMTDDDGTHAVVASRSLDLDCANAAQLTYEADHCIGRPLVVERGARVSRLTRVVDWAW